MTCEEFDSMIARGIAPADPMERSFLGELARTRDNSIRGIYADYLDEKGELERAQRERSLYQRLQGLVSSNGRSAPLQPPVVHTNPVGSESEQL